MIWNATRFSRTVSNTWKPRGWLADRQRTKELRASNQRVASFGWRRTKDTWGLPTATWILPGKVYESSILLYNMCCCWKSVNYQQKKSKEPWQLSMPKHKVSSLGTLEGLRSPLRDFTNGGCWTCSFPRKRPMSMYTWQHMVQSIVAANIKPAWMAVIAIGAAVRVDNDWFTRSNPTVKAQRVNGTMIK